MNQIKTSALIMGASGLVGRELVKILSQQKKYKRIHLLVRKSVEIPDTACEQHIIDFNQLTHYSELFQVTDVYCCLGTTIKKAKTKEAFRKVDFEYPIEAAKLAVAAGVEKFLIITSMGANPESTFFYNRVKGEVEESLTKFGLKSLHIFRPSLLLGERGEFRIGERIAAKASGVLGTFMKGPLRPYKAIQARTVAAAMLTVASFGKNGVHTYPSQEIEQLAKEKG